MADLIQVRRDTAANWTSANPTLAQGELGLETDTLKVKFGDGSTAWTSLAYYASTGGVNYLKLDQTTPQTIINGIPLLTGLTPTQDYEIATKKYVDDNSGASQTPWTSDINGGGYALSNATGNISMWTNDSGYLTSLSGAWLLNGNTNGVKKTLGSIDNYDIGFLTNNTERMTILAGGNVGIGTTSPGSGSADLTLLDVAGLKNSGAVEMRVTNTSTSNGYAGLKFITDTSDFRLQVGGTGSAPFGTMPAGAGAFGSVSNHALGFATNSTVRMVISINGNVGIGTTAPTAKLHLPAGTATAGTAPLKFTSGTDLTTAETGAMEYDGTNLHFTPTGTLREDIHFGDNGSVTLTAGTTTTVTNAKAKTTSTIIISPTSLAVIALTPYVSTKNNGSFVLTHAIAAGTETVDYLIVN